ncbi:MAG: hypothetical protein ACTSQZ_08590 [Candidatus Thorarchaeota archaeon]
MVSLSKARQTKKTSKLAFVDAICDMARRGDIFGIVESQKKYWKNKKSSPWHRVHKLIETHWKKEKEGIDASETLILLRDAVFGSLDIHSLSLAIDTPTHEIIEMFVKGKSRKDGRRAVRTFCSKTVTELIKKGNLDYLETASLHRDGFGYLVPSLSEKHLEIYKNARPKKEDGAYDLKPLARSIIGRRIFRDLQITKASLDGKDPLVSQLLENYDHLLLDLEIDGSTDSLPLGPTEQLTLNGRPIEEITEIEAEKPSKKRRTKEVQVPLTEYLPQKKEKKKPTKRKRVGRKALKKKEPPKKGKNK